MVDNNSIDGSLELLKSNFPDIKFIENKENIGFSKAHNQAIKASRGEYFIYSSPFCVEKQ